MKTKNSNQRYGITELFLLCMIGEGGLNTLYKLAQIGISPGGIRPALNRLEAGGLLKRSAAARYNKKEFKVTPAGERFLKTQPWSVAGNKQQLAADLESVLRTCGFVRAIRAEGGVAALVDEVARARTRMAETLKKKSEELENSWDLVSTYEWMVSLARSHQLLGEARAMKEIRDVMLRRKSVIEEDSNVLHKPD